MDESLKSHRIAQCYLAKMTQTLQRPRGRPYIASSPRTAIATVSDARMTAPITRNRSLSTMGSPTVHL
jgi:hypothetical protein